MMANRVGTYEIVCAQLCGSGHSGMKGTIVVDSESDYKGGLDDLEKLNAPAPATPPANAAAPGGGAATGTGASAPASGYGCDRADRAA